MSVHACVLVCDYMCVSVCMYICMYICLCVHGQLYAVCVRVSVGVCESLSARVCVHAAKLGAYGDHMFFPSVSIEVSGKELGTKPMARGRHGSHTGGPSACSTNKQRNGPGGRGSGL